MESPETLLDAGDRARAELAELIDRQMSPLGMAVMDALSIRQGETVLDVGCGAGETLLQLADRVGPSGHVIGVDVAPRVLVRARARTAHLSCVRLLQEDAATLALPDRSLDRVFSRFGTMFFVDPVAVFANLRRMIRPGGGIGFVCWRSMRENELDVFCVEAAGLPVTVDISPYSFEDADSIRRVLVLAGFDRVEVTAQDRKVSCGGVATTLEVVTRVGALGKVLRENTTLLPDARPKVRAALAGRVRNGTVHLGTATWIVTATT